MLNSMGSKWLAGVSAVTMFAVTACGTTSGNSSQGANDASGNGNASVSANGSGADTQNDLLAKVEQTHQLSLALAAFPPLEYQDAQTQKWKGVDIDVLSKFAKTLGATLQVDSMQFAASITSVSAKRDDITANIFDTPQREKVITFSAPVLKYQEGVIVNSKNPTVTDAAKAGLGNKTIATVHGTAEEAFVPKIPGATDKSYSDVNESFLALSAGRVDADLQPIMYAQWAEHTNPNLHIKVLGPTPVSITGTGANAPAGYYGVAKGQYSQRFLEKLNAFIKQEQTSGDLQQILDTYHLTSPSYLQGLGS